MDRKKHLFVGVDTHKNQHTAVVISCFHQKLGSVKTPNNPANYKSFINKLNSLDSTDKTLVFGL